MHCQSGRVLGLTPHPEVLVVCLIMYPLMLLPLLPLLVLLLM